jgi:outer membrane protein insertion porin family
MRSGLSQSLSDSTRYNVIFNTRDEGLDQRLHDFNNILKNAGLGRAEIERSLQQVLARFQQQQFYDAQIDSVRFRSAPKPQALVYLKSGARHELKLLASYSDTTKLNGEWQRELRGAHTETEWLTRMQNVLEDFARRGRPLASFELDSVSLRESEPNDKREALLHFNLSSGPLVRIDSIIVRGNKTTKAHVLLRELPVRVGDLFNLDAVQSIPEKLLRLGFIRSVEPAELRVNERGQYALEVNVREGNSNTLNGVAGYNPSVGAQKGFLTGLLDVQLGNLFGTGRSLNAHWEKRGPETQELGLRYREPWVRGYPVHLSGGFQQLLQDTLYVERKFDLSAEAPLANRLAALAAFTRESIVPDSLSALRLNLPASSITSVSAGLRFDSRDELFNPSRGFFYSTTLATGRKRVQSDSVAKSFSHKLVTLDVHWLIPTKWPQVLSLALHGRQVTSGEAVVSLTDQIRFGGATTLRGYREEQFRGSRVAWSNLEYRYLLSRYSRAFLFFDAGYFFRTEASASPAVAKMEIESVETSYGLGVRWETPVGIVGVDYGLGEGDGLFNGKVHVSLVNSF